MHSKPENATSIVPDGQHVPSAMVCSHPWWRGIGYGVAPPVAPESLSKSHSVESRDVVMETRASQVPAGDGEGAGASKEAQTMTAQSDGNQGCENQQPQQVTSTMPHLMTDYTVPHTQLELGHSACASYAYADPYYSGILAYGAQALVHPHMLGMHHTRMPLPLEMTEEPVYVNAKQYHGILRRRQSRAKAELEKKSIKVRKPYLHESRHQHAMRRARGNGGRFLNTKKLDSNATNATSEKEVQSGATDCIPHSTGTQKEVTGNLELDTREQNIRSNGNGFYQQHAGFPTTFHSLAGERGEEGDCSGQQRNGLLVSQAPHRALTIK